MIRILRSAIGRSELQKSAEESFSDLVKGVVDIGRGVMAVGANCMQMKKPSSSRMEAGNRICGG